MSTIFMHYTSYLLQEKNLNLNHKAQQTYLNFYVNVLNGNLSKMHYLLSCLMKQNKMNIN